MFGLGLHCLPFRLHNITTFFCNQYTVMFGLGKQCRPRSDCSYGSSLIWVYTVCLSVCIFWTHYSMVKPLCSKFRVITADFLGVRIFRNFTVAVSVGQNIVSLVALEYFQNAPHVTIFVLIL